MNNKLTEVQQDALKEIVTIGAGNAATALSQMIKRRINITVPRVNLVAIEDAADVFGGAEIFTVAVTLKLLGDATGAMFFSFKKEDALRLSNTLLGGAPSKSKTLSEMAQSALKEMATILAGSYLSAMSRLLKMRFLLSSPALTQDMAGAIIDDVIIETTMAADSALIMDTELNIFEERILAYFFFMPDGESLKKILARIGVE